MLKQRVIFGALGVVLAVLVLTLCNVTTIGVCVALISMIGLYEFYNVIGALKRKCPVVAAGSEEHGGDSPHYHKRHPRRRCHECLGEKGYAAVRAD